MLPTDAATGCRTGAVALEPLGQVGEVAAVATGGTHYTQAGHWKPGQQCTLTMSTESGPLKAGTNSAQVAGLSGKVFPRVIRLS